MKNIEIPTQFNEVRVSYKSSNYTKESKKINASSDIYNLLKEFFSEDIDHHEFFILIGLNRANKITLVKKISEGGISGTVADPKIIFQYALLTNCSNIILAHNHPSGNIQPSNSDISPTKKLKEAGGLLDIQVLDHLIITADNYFSFADEGLIN